MISLFGLDPQGYTPHFLHGADRTFRETNCYVDLWIEILHARRLDPLAMMAFSTVVDFEGDQWTFFKPPPADLETLYGMEVQELQVYRSLPEHIAEQLAHGRLVTVEVDGFFLPDTAGRSHHLSHEKTSIAVEAIDIARDELRYFHNGGYFALGGSDYRGALRLERTGAEDLPPYVEFIRMDRLAAVPPDRLRSTAADLLTRQLALRPDTNPVVRFGERLTADLPSLRSEERFHVYAFATLRQCGAAWEVAATFLRWLDKGHDDAADSFEELAHSSKALLFRLARASVSDREVDVGTAISELAGLWDAAFDTLTP